MRISPGPHSALSLRCRLQISPVAPASHKIWYSTHLLRASLVAHLVKSPLAMRETWVTRRGDCGKHDGHVSAKVDSCCRLPQEWFPPSYQSERSYCMLSGTFPCDHGGVPQNSLNSVTLKTSDFSIEKQGMSFENNNQILNKHNRNCPQYFKIDSHS